MRHAKKLLFLMVVLCSCAKIKKKKVPVKGLPINILAKRSKRDKQNVYLFLLGTTPKKSHNKIFPSEEKLKQKKKMLKIKSLNSLSDEDKYNLIKDLKKYCECTKRYRRLPTREVTIGNIKIGGNNKIAIQTMTSCDTRNVDECVYQIKKCKELGADLIRLTVQGVQEAEASYRIKEKLLAENITIPLVADIHFNPKISLMAADVFDKIRVNPGNYVDGRKKWINKVYKTREEFDQGRLFIQEKFVPLIEKCKRLNRAIRIGTNHGSLSSRVLSYYGDTPLGMVESAFEFSDLCVQNNFFNVVFSMKASNAYIMIQSYRLLVARQYDRMENGLLFPLHLGVTEAGFGDNGRIKSYLGIGSLLYDGIGDTIRISLTEDPWEELTPCKTLIKNLKKRIFFYDDPEGGEKDSQISSPPGDTSPTLLTFEEHFRNFNKMEKRRVEKKEGVLHAECTIGNVVTEKELEDSLQIFRDLNLEVDQNGNLKKGFKSTDIVVIPKLGALSGRSWATVERLAEAGLHVLAEYDEGDVAMLSGGTNGSEYTDRVGHVPRNTLFYLDLNRVLSILQQHEGRIPLHSSAKGYVLVVNGKEDTKLIDQFFNQIRGENPLPLFFLLKSDTIHEHVLATRRFNEIVNSLNIDLPYVHYANVNSTNYDDMLVDSTLYVGTCLIDLMGDGLIINVTNGYIKPDGDSKEGVPSSRVALNSFLTLNILQDTRARLFKTDYIACPSCGRTLFNIQETTKRIMQLTGHLKGVKIAVMGCIVNGIGEMADAHFGYVGSAPKKIDLYYGKELVERNIPEEEACDKLVELIKKHNMWQDP
ncbi:4-hydroxy-3-methylbut-2-en-1-yl diphosphate synthase [Plasmodium inui San Antonio 1]|uniref:4-hydroxy-3-methylbut-2-en-1-yl diphosphate synthase (ferredoxin), chloroplastic n=1 Tax=Plasmodium inui San Antonio 1 TaxID=1237626 RepID=W6ZZC7_9APIC|nr:4-hydroxy-3-methylbut-2-en-1-yl diphosphate synthase [Plasmodium inui San Antonio 1]EUD66257.1 4-hydroxy-3-methylbut-2-en-1-yl diphosphate synthase [Plasmodium inui San Antonio 1]